MAQEKRMGVLEHVEELRSRLIISLIAILVTTVLAYIFADSILYILKEPSGKQQLTFLSPLDPFMIKFRVALYGGIALAAPVWIYQLIRYIEPGLLPSEKRFIVPAVAAMVVLFFIGNAFGYMMLHNMMGVLISMSGPEMTYLASADQYISFVVYFLIAVGISFEMPIVLLILIRLGIVKPDQVRKQRKIAYFSLFVFAELITPVADPIVAPTVVMLPMLVLFELALFLSRFVVPKPTVTSPAPTTQKPA
ncbi:MAG: twin-arginine translocase subunit TatC [Chloroflexi bacterium]|nr:twin-arginine translocase subunit TatC [Chloroflexota bacterium]